MNSLDVFSPIKSIDDISFLVSKTLCKNFYVYHHKFLQSNFEQIQKFIDVAHQFNAKIYVNFKHNISDIDLLEIKKFLKYLKNTKIDGIFINSYAVLEIIKTLNLPFEVVIDSYFDIHNLAGIDFVKMFHNIDKLIITEEIYLKNITKIKKCTNLSLAIDSDNLPWSMEEIKKSDCINAIIIKGDFENIQAILEAVQIIETIIAKPKMFKNKKLPFKHVRKGLYKTNHFTGEILSTQGEDFKFSANIKKFEWNCKRSRLDGKFDYQSLNIPDLNLRLSSIEQLKQVKKYITKLGFNPIKSIEYGEILNTRDLSKSSFTEIIDYVKKFCMLNNIQLNLSTPKILIERDFDRVYEYVKNIALKQPLPTSIIANNIGYFWNFINDEDFSLIPIEIGYGINLLNSMSIECLCNLHNIEAVDLTVFSDIENIKRCIKKIKKYIPRRKITIAGSIKIPSLGLCPLNNDSAIISRLSCKAPCHNGSYAIYDPSLNKTYPFVVDGFCKMHMYQDNILNICHKIQEFRNIGINEFVIDFNSLNSRFVPVLLTNFLNALKDCKY